MITPTIGRMVWYRPRPGEMVMNSGEQLCSAQICYVWDDTMVNLSVLSHDGWQSPRTSVPLWQGDADECPEGSCCWMPYQKGQAAKTEKLEEELAESTA